MDGSCGLHTQRLVVVKAAPYSAEVEFTRVTRYLPFCQCLAFADDLVLATSMANGLQELTERIKYALGLGGLQLNPVKCATLRIDNDGGAKRWVANPTEFLTLEGSVVTSPGT